MKNFLFLMSLIGALTLISNFSFAVTFDILGPCSSKPVYQGIFKTDLKESVGQISIDLLDFNKIPYLGTEDGLNSILETPVGLDAVEVISDTKMRAYGWCYSINGEIPKELPSRIYFTNQSDHLVWFFAFSTYDKGEWLDYCIPSHTVKAEQFCSK